MATTYRTYIIPVTTTGGKGFTYRVATVVLDGTGIVQPAWETYTEGSYADAQNIAAEQRASAAFQASAAFPTFTPLSATPLGSEMMVCDACGAIVLKSRDVLHRRFHRVDPMPTLSL